MSVNKGILRPRLLPYGAVQQLADELGVRQPHISKWIHGDAIPSDPKIRERLRAAGLDIKEPPTNSSDIARRVGCSPSAVSEAIRKGRTTNRRLAGVLQNSGFDVLFRVPLARPYGVSRQRAHQINHPDRRKARGAVHDAVKRGLLKPASAYHCVDCGDPAQEYDHYMGYAKKDRYHIHPVCRTCHGKRYRSPHDMNLISVPGGNDLDQATAQ